MGPWIFASIALLIFAAFVWRFPKWTLLSIAGLIVVIAATASVFWFINSQKEQRSLSLIKTTDLDISEITTHPDDWSISGKITNNSDYTLESIRFRSWVRDCPKDGTCPIVGETEVTVYVEVPSKQARPFTKSLYFSPPITVKEGNWSTGGKLIEIRAKVEEARR